MDHRDHVFLLRDGIGKPGGIWADWGAGTGAFTLALAELLGPGATIIAVDTNQRALLELSRQMKSAFPHTDLHCLAIDFTHEVEVIRSVPKLDGCVMANALHFVRNKVTVVPSLVKQLHDGGDFLLVEYNTDQGNRWVPHALSFESWLGLSERCGLTGTRLVGSVPSRFLGEIYAAWSQRAGAQLSPRSQLAQS